MHIGDHRQYTLYVNNAQQMQKTYIFANGVFISSAATALLVELRTASYVVLRQMISFFIDAAWLKLSSPRPTSIRK